MDSLDVELFADYHQIHLSDDGSAGDLSEAWTDQAVVDRLAVVDDAMAIGTSVNVTVAVRVEVLDAPPAADLADYDHVVEGSMQVRSGRIVVMGCTDYEPDAVRVPVPVGPVRVRAASSNLAEAERVGVDSDEAPQTMERLRVQVWPAPREEPVVLKRWVGESGLRQDR
ncbi:hypothetical protein GA0070561_0184 [Micromonospora saelicesensis]|uniref:Uncharacterized protein n=1 Tax=Micromonospora saelicesensis TaxID=285676 RepID=A0A1C5AFK0_9ACTN|nr:hypothetical protein GA0070561_0184 [Micromonospora saelicesensis]